MSRYGERSTALRAVCRSNECIKRALRPCTPGDFSLLVQRKVTKRKHAPQWREPPRSPSHRAVKFSQSTSLCSVRTDAIPRVALRVHSAPAKEIGRAIGWIPTTAHTSNAPLVPNPATGTTHCRGRRWIPFMARPHLTPPSAMNPKGDAQGWASVASQRRMRCLATSQREAVRGGRIRAINGACFLFVPFLCTSKEKGPGVQGRSARLIYFINSTGRR